MAELCPEGNLEISLHKYVNFMYQGSDYTKHHQQQLQQHSTVKVERRRMRKKGKAGKVKKEENVDMMDFYNDTS